MSHAKFESQAQIQCTFSGRIGVAKINFELAMHVVSTN